MELDDTTLVLRTRAGDPDAFGLLVRRHLRAAHAVARAAVGSGADADDVVQEAFLVALERLEQCRDPDHFRAWLLSIVRTRGRNWLRATQRRRSEPLELASHLAGGHDPHSALERRELAERLSSGLARLGAAEREVLLLADLEGWSHAEVAQLLGLSEAASRQQLHRARRRLRAILKGDGTEHGHE